MVTRRRRTLRRDLVGERKVDGWRLQVESHGSGDRRGVVLPDRRVRIDIQLDVVSVGVSDVERLADAVLTDPLDLHTVHLELRLRLPERVEIIADLQGHVIQPDVGARRASGTVTDLYEPDVMVVSPGGQEHHQAVAEVGASDLAQPESVAVERTARTPCGTP